MPTPDKSEIQSTADRVYSTMIREHSGQTALAASVDVNPASWGMEINAWDWCLGVGVIAISEYFAASRREDVLAYLVAWVERIRHKDHSLADFLDMYDARPVAVVHDLHPDYASTQWAVRQAKHAGVPSLAVQHHLQLYREHNRGALVLCEVGGPLQSPH